MSKNETAIMDLPEPLVSVTPTGIFVEWHARGINVEVRMRETGAYVVVEDRYGRLQDYSGSDTSALGRALSALCVMESRGDCPVVDTSQHQPLPENEKIKYTTGPIPVTRSRTT